MVYFQQVSEGLPGPDASEAHLVRAGKAAPSQARDEAGIVHANVVHTSIHQAILQAKVHRVVAGQNGGHGGRGARGIGEALEVHDGFESHVGRRPAGEAGEIAVLAFSGDDTSSVLRRTLGSDRKKQFSSTPDRSSGRRSTLRRSTLLGLALRHGLTLGGRDETESKAVKCGAVRQAPRFMVAGPETLARVEA